MKNVLISSYSMPPKFGGAGLRAYRYAERMQQRGRYRPVGLTVGRAKLLDEPFEINRITLFDEKGIMFPLSIIESAIKANLFLRKKEIDILHLFSLHWFHRVMMISNMLFYHKPVIVESTLDGFDDPMSLLRVGLRNRMAKALTRRILSGTDCFIAGSDKCVESARNAGMRPEQVKLMARPVDETIFGSIPLDDKAQLRKKLNLPEGYIFLHVGRLQKRKNQLFLAKALNELGRDEAKLVLVGPPDSGGAYADELKRYVDTHLRDNVIFAGEQKGVNEYMVASDALVFASEQEGFPNVVVEALVSGLPVISVELDSVNPYITGLNGKIVKNTDNFDSQTRAAFCSALAELCAGTLHFDRGEIRKVALGQFSAERLDGQYEALYKELTRGLR